MSDEKKQECVCGLGIECELPVPKQELADKEKLITGMLNEMLDRWSIPPLKVIAFDWNRYERTTEVAYEARGKAVLVLRVPDAKIDNLLWLEDYIGLTVTANLKEIVAAFGGV